MRPTEQIILTTKDGKPVTGTIKTPKINLVAKVRQIAVRHQFAIEQHSSLFQTSNLANRELAHAEIELEAAKADLAKEPESEHLRTKLAMAEAAYADTKGAVDALAAKLEAKVKDQDTSLIEQLQLIVNLPNEKSDVTDDERRRSIDEIDWESLDMEAAAEAVNFFFKGKKS